MELLLILKSLGTILLPLFAAVVVLIFFYVAKRFIINFGSAYFRKRNFSEGSKWRSDAELVHWLGGLSPKDFEEQTAEMFKRLGYTVKVTGQSHDIGVDVELKKDGKKSIVQCKHYSSKIGRDEVAKFYGDLAHHFATNGYFVTTNYFTLEAIKYVADKPIELIDGNQLIKYMKQAKMNL